MLLRLATDRKAQSMAITVDPDVNKVRAKLIQPNERAAPGAIRPRIAELDERAARDAIRRQIGRLEYELSALVASAFPHVSPAEGGGEALSGPRLLSLGELERVRDRLVAEVSRARRQASERAELERRAQSLLERMKREPARYKFTRLPVVDLGGSCGIWVVRPRLGLIGMLAGWWQVKLSSGCP